jgi:hypothetical protein
VFIGFPVVDPAPGGEPLGVARVSAAPFVDNLSRLPHERFAVDNAWNAWSFLYPQTHWPESLYWEPLSLYGGECWLEPEQWHGSSANFATLLAMTFAKGSVQARRLQTQHIWATGLLGIEGGAVQLRRVNHITSKVQTFVRYCELHPEATAGAVFFLPATCVQELQSLLEKTSEIEHCFFSPSMSALPKRKQPLLCFVKINQVDSLLLWLQTSALSEFWERSRWYLLAAMVIIVVGVGWGTILSLPPPRSLQQSSSPPLPRLQRKIAVVRISLKQTKPASSILRKAPQTRRIVSKKKKTSRKRTVVERPDRRPSPYWRVALFPEGYGRRYRWFLEGVQGVQRTDKALLIPRSSNRAFLNIVLVYETATKNFAPCKLRLAFTKTQRLHLKPLTPMSQTTRDNSYCRRK